MIDLEYEKNRKLSTQDMYDIVSFSVDSAYDNGFMNSFIFERALYVFAAAILFEDSRKEITELASKNMNEAWDKTLELGLIDKLYNDYQEEMNSLADCGKVWFDEYSAYAHSARGVLDVFQNISGNFLQSSLKQIRDAAQEEGISNVLDIADKWGMNNGIETPVEEQDMTDSVFE